MNIALFTALLGAAGCGDDTPATTATSSTGGSGGSGATGGGGSGGGGSGGEEAVPPLDPAACPVTADSGVDPALAAAAESQWSASFMIPESASIEQDKAFFLATLLRADTALVTALASDAALSAIGKDRDERLRGAPAMCAEDPTCYGQALTWTEADAVAAAEALRKSLEATGMLAALAKDMRSSGRFALHATADDGALVETAFVDLTVALGKTFGDEAASLGGAKLQTVVQGVAAAHPAPFAFFEPLLEVTLAALTADMRDEAARYEPLAAGENAKALAHIPEIDWSKFPFTVILVPGMGPSDPEVVLSPTGQARADLAVQRFKAGVAPLIALSGGHVHPDRTPYSEAIEMKRYLMDERGLPEEALLIDPHARHTTTNLRNVSRLIYRYGVPADRPLLVTSDFGQSLYIAFWHGTFGPRCQDELGYLPWRSLVSISENDACMMPVAVSLHADGRDPLDP